jgi:cytochrome b561
MPLRNSIVRYGIVAKVFHWVLALLIIDLVMMGLFMTGMPDGPDKPQIYHAHKLLGMTAMVIATLRLIWRITDNPAPKLPDVATPLQRRAARTVQAVMYVLMLAVPLLGLLLSQAAGKQIPFPVDLPVLVARNEELRDIIAKIHGICALTLMGLVLGHMAMALYHHIFKRDHVLRAMTYRKNVNNIN